MNPASEDIKDILEAESSLGLALGTDLFIGKEPADPNNCVTIFDTPGLPPQLTLAGKGEDYFYPSIQVRVRNTNYLTAYSLADSIRDVLHGLAHETWNGTLYILIQCTQGPALLDWDENNRCRFIINFNVQRR
jgi:hypothetical protein